MALDGAALDSVDSSTGSGVGPGGSAGSGGSSVVGPEPSSGTSTIGLSEPSGASSLPPAAAAPWPMAPARTIVATTVPTTIAVLLLSRGGAPAGAVDLTATGASTSSLRLRWRVALLPARVAVPQTTQKLAPSSSGISQEGQNAVPRAASLRAVPAVAPSSAASSTAKCRR